MGNGPGQLREWQVQAFGEGTIDYPELRATLRTNWGRYGADEDFLTDDDEPPF